MREAARGGGRADTAGTVGAGAHAGVQMLVERTGEQRATEDAPSLHITLTVQTSDLNWATFVKDGLVALHKHSDEWRLPLPLEASLGGYPAAVHEGVYEGVYEGKHMCKRMRARANPRMGQSVHPSSSVCPSA